MQHVITPTVDRVIAMTVEKYHFFLFFIRENQGLLQLEKTQRLISFM